MRRTSELATAALTDAEVIVEVRRVRDRIALRGAEGDASLPIDCYACTNSGHHTCFDRKRLAALEFMLIRQKR